MSARQDDWLLISDIIAFEADAALKQGLHLLISIINTAFLLTLELPLPIAPFVGILRERVHQVKVQGLKFDHENAPSVLVFGCRHPDRDFIYEELIEEAL